MSSKFIWVMATNQ